MTVAELTKKLNTFDPKKNVFIIFPDDNPLDSGSDIDNIFEISGSNKELENAVYLKTS